jgi:hypothetical protein
MEDAMPPKKRPGMTPLYVEIPDEMAEQLADLCDRLPLGGKADHVRLAIARHLKTPPTVDVPDLPPMKVKPPKPPPPARGPR